MAGLTNGVVLVPYLTALAPCEGTSPSLLQEE